MIYFILLSSPSSLLPPLFFLLSSPSSPLPPLFSLLPALSSLLPALPPSSSPSSVLAVAGD